MDPDGIRMKKTSAKLAKPAAGRTMFDLLMEEIAAADQQVLSVDIFDFKCLHIKAKQPYMRLTQPPGMIPRLLG
jgi:hypothetical protein